MSEHIFGAHRGAQHHASPEERSDDGRAGNSILLAGHSGKLLSTSSTPVGVQRWGSTCPESIRFLKEFLKEFDLGLVQLRSHLAQCRPVQSSSSVLFSHTFP